MTSPLTTLEVLCRDGISFEEALVQAGFANSPLTITTMLFKHWKLLKMEHAFNSARIFYDRFLEIAQ